MLVLSRHQDERIVIGGNIIITVVRIDGNKVVLGIDAPKDVPINREEIEDLQREQQNENPQPLSSLLRHGISRVD